MDKFSRKTRAKIGDIKNQLFTKNTPEEEIIELPQFKAHFNSPTGEWVKEKTVKVEGWLLPDGENTVKALRVRNGNKIIDLPYGSKRHDVLKAFPDHDKKKALHSGFKKEFTYQEDYFAVEVDLGMGWQLVKEMNIKYSPEDLVDMIYDSSYAMNWAEHKNLVENKSKYYYEPAQEAKYESAKEDPRLVTFYLPQFHPIKENDIAWGKGFTEWTNVASAQPRFVGHTQPLLPSDLGFYDLRLAENIKEQIDLAKKHGIHGFCFYYYWFSSARLLEKPLDIFFKHKEFDFNFMIAWANENWTKRWDGMDNDVIIAQKYLQSDPLDFIKDVEHLLLDPRYIKENGKPVLVVYRGSKLDNPSRYVKVWRKYFKDKHGMELHILYVLGLDVIDPRPLGFDAGIEFEPLTVAKRLDFTQQKPLPINVFTQLLDKDFTGGVADYRQVALVKRDNNAFEYPTYRSVMPSWDNDARKKGKGPTVFHGANADIYGRWLDSTLNEVSRENEAPLVFINAWNEWAEGAVLEPTRQFGHAYLNRTTEVLSKYSSNEKNKHNFPMYGLRRVETVETAVHVHVFYEKEWEYISKRLQKLPQQFDLFITLTERSKTLESNIKSIFPDARITHVPNRGRDILPFVLLLPKLKEAGYKYVLKLHTKKSLHRTDGAIWFKDLVDKLTPTRRGLDEIIDALSQDNAGMIGPAEHFVSSEVYLGSNESHMKKQLNDRYESKIVKGYFDALNTEGYFAGSMFWARIDALDSIIDLPFIIEEFESEKGQIDGTMAHAAERMIGAIMVLGSRKVYKISSGKVTKVTVDDITRDYEYVK